MNVLNLTRRAIWILCLFCIVVIVVSNVWNVRRFPLAFSETDCPTVLSNAPNGFKIVLSNVNGSSCEFPITLAMPSYLALSIAVKDYPDFEIIFYENTSFVDYYKFYADITRVTPKFEIKEITKDLHVPVNPKRVAEYWRRSRLIDCHNLVMNRNKTDRKLPLESSITALRSLRDTLVSFDMYPYLEGGTLLGWYRECSVIPHTRDMDFVVDIDQFNPEFEKYARNKTSLFKLYRKLGDPKDSMEYTVYPSTGYKTPIDIFFMYHDEKEYWIAGTSGSGNKYRYSFPYYDPYCSGIIHGYLFWVSCTPDAILSVSFGPQWYRDHPTSKFNWESSSKNVRKVGKFSKAELTKYYKIY